jgi:hypothetical protein
MIDDFQVPHDPGYPYDNYGPNKALTLDHTKPASEMFGLDLFFPSVPSHAETGARRGCVVMARRVSEASILKSIPGLRRLDPSS